MIFHNDMRLLTGGQRESVARSPKGLLVPTTMFRESLWQPVLLLYTIKM